MVHVFCVLLHLNVLFGGEKNGGRGYLTGLAVGILKNNKVFIISWFFKTGNKRGRAVEN